MGDNISSPLGLLPEGWKLVELRELATKIGSGATPRGGESAYLRERLRFALVRSQNIYDRRFDVEGLAFISDDQALELGGVSLKPGDLLLNITGDGVTFARSCVVPEEILPACVNQHVAIIRLRSDICMPGYLLSYLTHPDIKRYIESFNAGGSRRAVTKGNIESFLVPLPPLAQQEEISGFLGALDDKIELNRRMNQTLEAMAHSIFKAWFVDFDPLREGHPLFPSRLEKTSSGVLPAGWTVEKLGNCCEFRYGKAMRAGDRKEGVIPVFGSNGQVGWHDAALVRGPGIVVGRKGNPGTVVWVSSDFFPIDTSFYVVNQRDALSLFYLFHALSMLDLPSLSADSAVPGLNRSIAYLSEILVPPSLVVEHFDRQVAPLQEKADANLKESSTLACLRDTLLPKLLSGEIRVKQAEKIVEEVV